MRSTRNPNILDVDRDRRMRALTEFGVLDRLGDPVLTGHARLARALTGAAGAAMHVFDDAYQRRIAAVGVPLVDYPAEGSLCRQVVLSGTRIVSSDLVTDPRFAHALGESEAAEAGFYASVPVRIDNGITIGTVCVFDSKPRQLTDEQITQLEDIADLTRAHLQLVHLATSLGEAATLDALTGAVNRVIFDDRLAQALSRRRRHGSEVFVAVIDLDDFKALNDTYGHASGDRALRWVTGRLKERVRREDTVGRLGGDEFGVVAELADDAADLLLSDIKRAAAGFEPPFTLSVGAVLAQDSDDVESVVRRADQAMYAVKAQRGGAVQS
jgi:diguanylate cyclase (GGDEF)-like protein